MVYHGQIFLVWSHIDWPYLVYLSGKCLVYLDGLPLLESRCQQCVEVLGKPLISCYLCPPSSDGYLVERKSWIVMIGYSCSKVRKYWILPRGDETVKECVPILGVKIVVCWSYRDTWTINMYIYIYLFICCFAGWDNCTWTNYWVYMLLLGCIFQLRFHCM